MIAEISLGKTNTLLLTPAESTVSTFLAVLDVIRMCLLIQSHSLVSSSCSSVPTTQSSLLQSIPHEKPPCLFLHLEPLPSRVWDLHPWGFFSLLEKSYIRHSRHTMHTASSVARRATCVYAERYRQLENHSFSQDEVLRVKIDSRSKSAQIALKKMFLA